MKMCEHCTSLGYAKLPSFDGLWPK